MSEIPKVDSVYYGGERHDVANLVPLDARSVLDIGCGYGGIGQLLAKTHQAQLYGIELNPEATPYLENLYHQHWIGSVEEVRIPEDVPGFDCIIFSDVLEHLVDPWGTLAHYVARLNADGTIIASIPNVRNLNLLLKLMIRGEWTYLPDGGLLDKTHLRFFTRSEIEKLFNEAGLDIEFWAYNRDKYSIFRRIVTAPFRIMSPDLEVCQFLIRAHKKSTLALR